VTDYVEQLDQAVRAVRIVTPTRLSWFGVRSPSPPARIRPMLTPETARAHLLAVMRDRLYEDFYCAGTARHSLSRDRDLYAPAPSGRLAPAMSSANTGRGSWESGWVLRVIEDGLLAVRRNGLELWVRPEDCLTDAEELAPDQEVAIRLPNESFEMAPGYYCALSDEPFPWEGDGPVLIRVYLNVRPDQAASCVAVLTGRLNAAHVPFRLKVLNDEQSYRRCDTAVLYLRQQDFGAATEPLARAVDDLHMALRPAVPAMTKVLAPGVGLAEDPGSPGESFGQQRCGLIAEGVVRAREARIRSAHGRLATVLDVFHTQGVDPERPYLNSGAPDHYALPAGSRVHAIARTQLGNGAVTSRADGSTVLSAVELLDVAERIGNQLKLDAVWHGDRCSWLGLVPTSDDRGSPVLAYGAIGSSLYDGVSGVGYFLAVLAALTGDKDAALTARAAARQSLTRARQDPDMAPGLYTGTIGICLAATVIAKLTGDEELAMAARRLVSTALSRRGVGFGFDVLSGRAGAAVGLLALSALFEDGALVEDAVRLGEELVAAAVRSDEGWSWRAEDGLRHPNLTGLSHGAAGAGYALLELFRVTGDSRWVTAARQAFRYERRWYSPKTRNWPDLRDGGTPGQPSVFLTQWCHGAPGIALTRLRAAELLRDATLRDEAATALSTTVDKTRTALVDGSLSFSLCHGLAGNADVLLEGVRLADGETWELPAQSVITNVATAGHARHVRGGAPWPCGIPVPGSETPGLMLGLAGIGYHYLRLAYPDSIPSVLLLRPERLAADIAALATDSVRPPYRPALTLQRGAAAVV
jgi:hypothetical protein